MFVISPWSRGGWVNSEVFDHTSVAMFLEKRFGVTCTSISPWHRAVCGDLTSAFDFATPNDSAFPSLPNMSNYAAIDAAQSKLPYPTAPASRSRCFKKRARARRALCRTCCRSLSRPRPACHASVHQRGRAGAVFHVYDLLNPAKIPAALHGPGAKSLTDTWICRGLCAYHLRVYGPNGFARYYYGFTNHVEPYVEVTYDAAAQLLVLGFENPGAATSASIVSNSAALKIGVGTWQLPRAAIARRC